MGLSVFPAPVASSKTAFRTTLTSGTSWTVPTGVTYINATLVGGGGGGGCAQSSNGLRGAGGQVIESTFATTPGASISYAIGAGGAGAAAGSGVAPSGGTTTMTGATSALGGSGGNSGRDLSGALTTTPGTRGGDNGGQPGTSAGASNVPGGAGGSGAIYIEYWA